MRSINRGRPLWRFFGLTVVVAILGVILGAGGLSVQTAAAQPTGTPGAVTVQKRVVDPSGNVVTGADLSGFIFDITPLTGGATVATPATGSTGVTSLPLPPGDYAISERPRAGFTFVSLTPSPAFTIPATGNGPVITATNQVAGAGQVSVQKLIVDANGAAVTGADVSGFQFTVAGPSGFSATQTTGTTGLVTFANLAAGSYTVTEQTRSGFSVVATTVDGVGSTQTPTFQVGGTAPASRSVVFGNRQVGTAGTVTIQKQLVDAAGNLVSGVLSGFQFTITCGTGFGQQVTTDGSGTVTLSNVPAGNCTVSEASREGFTLVSITPGTSAAIQNGGTFAVTAGQTVTLAVRNRVGATGTGTVTVTKQIVDASGNVLSGQALNGFTFTVTCGTGVGAFSQQVTSDANGLATVANVPAGSCTFTETARAGFSTVSITPGSGTAIGSGGTITVTSGQTLNVAVRNRQGGGTTEQVPLVAGCNNVALTFPSGTPVSTVASAVSPPGALLSIFRYDAAQNRFFGFSPLPNAPNDYLTVTAQLETVFICMTAPGTFNRPGL